MKYDSWNCLNSYLIVSKLKVVALHILNRPADVVDLCEKVIALLDKGIAHPERNKGQAAGMGERQGILRRDAETLPHPDAGFPV